MAKNIFIVRHGEALQQVDADVWKDFSNEEVPLTSLGKFQALDCGRFFADKQINPETTLIIASPFKRAVQTAEQIIKKIPELQMVEEPLLVEQNFGMFTGLTTEQCYEKYPALAKLYDIHAEKDGNYLVTPPKGESKADVVKRVEQFVNKISSWFENSRYENLIVVSHCVVSRALSKVLENQTPEWFLGLRPLPNCSVKQFSKKDGVWVDRGFVFIPEKQGKNITLAGPENER